MSTGKLIYIIVMGWTLIVIGGITYLFKKQKDFTFLSGFSNRPDEEKQYLKESGYLTAISNVFFTSFWILLITFIVGLFPIPWAFEIGFSIFIVHLMISLVWVQRYEVPHKRKKMYWVMGFISAGTIIFIAVITSLGFINKTEIHVHEDTLEVTGMYGVEWDLSDIERVELLDELPEVLIRMNGFSMPGVLKGHFKLEEPYGHGLLFVQGNEEPYLAIFTSDNYMIINRKENEETLNIYEQLQKATKK